MMDHADMPRQGDLDGRGNLSRRALAEFTVWFLKICLDQVTFMTGLFALDRLAERLRLYADRRPWKLEAVLLLDRILHASPSRRSNCCFPACFRRLEGDGPNPTTPIRVNRTPTPPTLCRSHPSRAEISSGCAT
jgi:hypothetical protein